MGTVVVGAIVVVIAGLAIRSIRKDKMCIRDRSGAADNCINRLKNLEKMFYYLKNRR